MTKEVFLVLPRREVSQEKWDAYVLSHGYGTFWHTYLWIDYLCAYQEENVDYSRAILDEKGNVYAILVLVQERGTFLSNGGQPPPAPLITATNPEYLKMMCTLVKALKREMNHNQPIQFFFYPAIYMRELIGNPSVIADALLYHSCLDLLEDYETLWGRVRASYRNLINRRKAEGYQFVPGSREEFRQMRSVHAEERGIHRHGRTWELMDQWVHNEQASFFVVKNPDMMNVGFALFIHCGRVVYYGSAVYLERDISHFAIWSAVELFRKRQKRWLDLGELQDESSDQKKRNISFFKAGFGGERHLKYLMGLE